MNFDRKLTLLSTLIFLTICASPAYAQVRLPSVLADHMVLQRNSTVRLWGWSGASETIKVTPSWDGHTYDVKADRNAKWDIVIPTPEAGGPHTIEIQASNHITLRDIMVGEVWLCSGQSNMEWSAEDGFEDAERTVAAADMPNIRLFEIPRTTAEHPQEDVPARWEVCTPESLQDFSAVGYFFGKHLQEDLNVPIGLIQSAWGGTAAEVWTPEEVIESDAEFSGWDGVLAKRDWWPRRPGVLYNAMIHPIIRFKLAGAIWYQGESNTMNPITYRRLFPSMIDAWREAWQFPMPFYYVQIAPFNYGTPLQGALVREAQLMAMGKVPNTGMAVISDIGDIYDIHPRNKKDVGKRLANIALAKTYGKRDIVYSGPVYKSHREEFGKMIISFDHAEDGLLARGPLQGFELAGEDQIYFPADAEINADEVEVVSDYVLNPVAIRFGFGNTTETNLFNQYGLPASSFRTEDWPILIKKVNARIEYKPETEAYLVTLSADADVEQIKYTTNGEPPGLTGLVYRDPFYIQNECTIRALAFAGTKASDAETSLDIRMNLATYKPTDMKVTFENSRSAGGNGALIDGYSGSNNFNDGRWQGYLGRDMSITLDFGKREEISDIHISALKNQAQGIFLPNKVTFEISNDGERFVEVYRKPLFHGREQSVEVFDYDFEFRNPRKTRYVRISAQCMDACPPWHSAAGEKAWMMFDEIVIN